MSVFFWSEFCQYRSEHNSGNSGDVKGKIKRGGYFEELTTDDEKDDDLKFKKKVVNEVKEDGDPNEGPVIRGSCTSHMEVWGNILLTMQACFIVLATKGCNGCNEMSKTLENVSSHLEGWHVMDVYKPYKAREMTVNISSNCSNRLCCQLPYWLMTTGADLRRMLCQGRPTEQVVDFVKLTLWRSRMWTQLKLDYLIGSVEAAQISFARNIAELASGVAKWFGLWAERKSCRVQTAMSKDEVTVMQR